MLEVMGTDGRVCVLNIFYGQYKAGTDDLQYKKYYVSDTCIYTVHVHVHTCTYLHTCICVGSSCTCKSCTILTFLQPFVCIYTSTYYAQAKVMNR